MTLEERAVYLKMTEEQIEEEAARLILGAVQDGDWRIIVNRLITLRYWAGKQEQNP